MLRSVIHEQRPMALGFVAKRVFADYYMSRRIVFSIVLCCVILNQLFLYTFNTNSPNDV
jgi:hypothetical protein